MRLWDKCWMFIMFFFKNIFPFTLSIMILFLLLSIAATIIL